MLRGINVSGQKKIKMAELREHLLELPFENVQTYIQSGNIVLDSKITDAKKIEGIIIDKIKEKYGWDVPTTSKTADQFKYVLDTNPFAKDPKREVKKICVVFLSEKPKTENIHRLAEYKYEGEEYEIDGDYIYFYAGNGFGIAKMSNNFFESKLKVKATSRNWNTVNKLFEMAKD